MSLKQALKKKLITIILKINRIKQIDKLVLFTSFGGLTYSDNPRAISEALHDIDSNVEIVWAFLNPSQKAAIVPEYVKIINAKSLICYYTWLSKAAVWVCNNDMSSIIKREKQIFIQTWHGDRAFKKVLYDSPFKSESFWRPESEEGFCDLAVAGSNYGEKQYRSAFRYKGEIMKVGTPRNDVLVKQNPEKIANIKTSLDLHKNVKILLYAPTLRRSNKENGSEQQIQDINIQETLNNLEEKYCCKWVCLLRAHPGTNRITGISYGENIRDVSAYEDMADLLLVSDMLVTDYSSCAGDYALTGRPIILYQSDRSEYIKKDRTFYFDIEESPYYVAESQEELNKKIRNLTLDNISKNCKDILDFYGTYESGNSAHTVANWILKKLYTMK